ncbi:MAG: putative baseplate assembly protein [Anaerolineae bacterium]|nr:putative baseplate assembly protein [Anaerolineae bacterium]
MSLPSPNLDDLRFQHDLVDEARRRIIRYCPEWTDYNLSDPGITLIELFAWMTEMMIYRLNRVPEKNYIKFLEMIGTCLQPASSARAEVTFYLSVPFPITPEDETVVIVPQGLEVATRPTEEEGEVTYTLDERLVLMPPKLVQVRRDLVRGGVEGPGDVHKNYLSRFGVEIFYPFSRPTPREGDTFYLGFDPEQSISGHILRLAFECEETQAVGVRREDPPLMWECSMGDGRWEEVLLSTRRGEKDTTGGLNNPRGALTLYLPLNINTDQVHGRTAYWLRCRLEQRREEQGMYTEPPRIKSITAYVIGGTTRATHAVVVRGEEMGYGSGEPGLVLRLRHAPVLALRPGETVEVEEKREGETVFVPWQAVPDFAQSKPHDRHFTLDEATGEICFGPAIRQPDGTVRQYGRVPEAGRKIRFSQYRHGGGVAGNVPAGKIQMLKSAVPYVDRVINLKRAEGGRDQENLEEAKMRAARELRAQQRAVTAEDFESLALGTGREVARVKCQAPGRDGGALPPGMVELLVVPSAFDALQAGDLSALTLDLPLQERILAHLDQHRLLTTTLRVREPDYLGVRVAVQVVAGQYTPPEVVRSRVEESLRQMICPLAPDNSDRREEDLPEALGADWRGWPFGRDLYVSEIYSLIQQVPGVKHVLDVRLSYRPVIPSRERASMGGGAQSEGEEAETSRAPLTQVTQRMLRVPPDTLLCSLDHEVQVVEL